MKKFLLKNEDSAKAQGFYVNWEFVNDKNFNPLGMDITVNENLTTKEIKLEFSILNQDGTVTLYVGKKKEIYELKTKLLGTIKKTWASQLASAFEKIGKPFVDFIWWLFKIKKK